MYVEELIIDGFKSYATRTVIRGWDAQFNAITGLNGAGKSNILDALCFVLGITTLSHVRANNLQDLVYKRGQAGVVKASVTAVFNNMDKTQSPYLYERQDEISITRQISLGGGVAKNKYLINGVNKTHAEVADLLQSVQLNINNPHFLIMQGRVTKVLNMKPQEFLAMIEEAAGTRMYEEKKAKAFRNIEKKEAKLAEITQLLQNEILPKVNKLKEAKRQFLEFQKLDHEVRQLTETLVLYDLCRLRRARRTHRRQARRHARAQREAVRAARSLADECETLQASIRDHVARRTDNNTTFNKLESAFAAVKKTLLQCQTQLELRRASRDEDAAHAAALQRQTQQHAATVAQLAAALDQLQARTGDARRALEARRAHVRKLEARLEALSTGMANKHAAGAADGADARAGSGGYEAELQAARTEVGRQAGQMESCRMRLAHFEKERASRAPHVAAAAEQMKGMQAEIAAGEAACAQLQAEADAVDYSAEEDAALQQRHDQLAQELHQSARPRQRQLENQLSHTFIQYRDPSPDFDRADVLGCVAHLFELVDPAASQALAVAAGGRLYHIVVRNEVVGRLLLERGGLKRRVTLIPLTKIKPYPIEPARLRASRQRAPAVRPALDLVRYEPAMADAMAFVFGGTLVCDTGDTAKRATFDPSIRMRSVTLDGDVYDPSGSLSGGAPAQQNDTLQTVAAYRDATARVAQLEHELADVAQALERQAHQRDQHAALSKRADMKRHEVALLKAQLSSNKEAQLVASLAHLDAQIEKEQAALAAAAQAKEAAEQECAALARDRADYQASRDTSLDALEKELAALRRQVNDVDAVEMQQQDTALELARTELAQAEREYASSQAAIAEHDALVAANTDTTAQLEARVKTTQLAYDRAERDLDQERRTLSTLDTASRELEATLQLRKHEQSAQQRAADAHAHSHAEERSQVQATATELARLAKTHAAWLPHTLASLGIIFDADTARAHLEQLSSHHGRASRNLDHDAVHKLDRIEKQETGLQVKLQTLQRDKEQIKETIQTLDAHKMEKLTETWEKVNSEFGAIFGDLLPGSTCKLVATDPADLTRGLEVRVFIGGVWKNSLTELSGGQRSLIALSLILALLQYKPAPMYVLDEVDAALDLSHTQNMGHLVANRFKGSQFIIVSLKEGMFTSANVLFRARFADGVSHVDRT
ncbi:hypothetical protein CXG81DRAFT_6336, partial [Caulochytrium protostelioides]